jgi:hypothetical protein
LSGERLRGIAAEFDGPQALVGAVRRLREAGFQAIDAFSPHAVPELDDALCSRRSTIPRLVLAGGAFGAGSGLWLQYYGAAVSYPINIGGRPLASWPAFIPTTIEMAVLWAVLAAVFGGLYLAGLPHLSHWIFHAPGFEHAAQDRFFVVVKRRDPQFDRDAIHATLARCDPLRVEDVVA